MHVSIASDVMTRYPSYRLILIAGQDLRVSPADDGIETLVSCQEQLIRETMNLEALHNHPHIAAWRETYVSFGAKPNKCHCAVESLLRTVLKRGSLPRINSLVNLCNYVSLRQVLPIDVMDLEGVEGDVGISFAKGDERFLPLGATELDPPQPGEVIYHDAIEVLGRRWNWRKCDKNKTSATTTRIMITIEGVGNTLTETLEKAEAELLDLIPRFCGGVMWSYRLALGNTHAEISFH